MRKLSPKEQWLVDYVASGHDGWRSFGEIFAQHDLDHRSNLTKNYIKVLTFSIREKGVSIETVPRRGLRVPPSRALG